MKDGTEKAQSDKIVVTIDPDLEGLIPGYLANRRKDIESVKTAIEAEDFELINRLGHSMKGSGAGYGFGLVSTLGASLEKAGEAGDAKTALDVMAQLARYLDRIEIVYESL
ncbi:MAG: Hpt domain-containing protein [Nitrospinae bacterium]|nr:Hpt domain-containing protein [Nitrospinota bacterium]